MFIGIETDTWHSYRWCRKVESWVLTVYVGICIYILK